MPLSTRLPRPAALLAALTIAVPGLASAQTVTPQQKKIQAVTAAAPAADVREDLSAEQLAVSDRVLTGVAACEFSQSVSIKPVSDRPGHFHVAYNGQTYTMTPETTTTGAVRLVDQRNGVVWIQIPAKSMMLNHKVGRRMVDSCQHAEQRTVAAAATTQ